MKIYSHNWIQQRIQTKLFYSSAALRQQKNHRPILLQQYKDLIYLFWICVIIHVGARPRMSILVTTDSIMHY